MALLNGTAGKPPAQDNSDLTGDTDNPTMNGEDGQDAGADDQDVQDGAEDDDGTVVCTVLVDKDGKYTLVTGDEPDSADGLAAPEGASPAEGGTPMPPAGQQFDEIGPLLKAILDLLRNGEGEGGDGGQSSFEDGFNSKPKA